VEDLLQEQEPLVRPALQVDEEGRHLRLPAGVHGGRRHTGLRRQQVVAAQEQRIVAPARVAQRGEHLGPHGPVPILALVQPLGPHLELEAVARHEPLPCRSTFYRHRRTAVNACRTPRGVT
jgi:hypothetical protein